LRGFLKTIVSHASIAPKCEAEVNVHTIQSVGVFSLAKISGLTYAVFGLLLSPILLAFGLLQQVLGRGEVRGPGVAGAIVLAFLVPVLYGVMGFVGGALAAFLYNLLANWVGGIQIELRSPAAAAPQAAASVTAPAMPL
jgi:hypothetical protein